MESEGSVVMTTEEQRRSDNSGEYILSLFLRVYALIKKFHFSDRGCCYLSDIFSAPLKMWSPMTTSAAISFIF